jgi:uncharacterized protein (DUF3820 family)
MILPFGKYAGMDIEQIAQDDGQYCDWLLRQPWFEEKYAILYDYLINHS